MIMSAEEKPLCSPKGKANYSAPVTGHILENSRKEIVPQN